MKNQIKKQNRRGFIKTSGKMFSGSLLVGALPGLPLSTTKKRKTKIALVGTGTRGINMYGRTLIEQYNEYIDYAGLCDINPGRLKYAKEYICTFHLRAFNVPTNIIWQLD